MTKVMCNACEWSGEETELVDLECPMCGSDEVSDVEDDEDEDLEIEDEDEDEDE